MRGEQRGEGVDGVLADVETVLHCARLEFHRRRDDDQTARSDAATQLLEGQLGLVEVLDDVEHDGVAELPVGERLLVEVAHARVEARTTRATLLERQRDGGLVAIDARALAACEMEAVQSSTVAATSIEPGFVQ